MIKLHHNLIWLPTDKLSNWKYSKKSTKKKQKLNKYTDWWLTYRIQHINLTHHINFDVFTVGSDHVFGYWCLKVIKTMRYLELRDN